VDELLAKAKKLKAKQNPVENKFTQISKMIESGDGQWKSSKIGVNHIEDMKTRHAELQAGMSTFDSSFLADDNKHLKMEMDESELQV
jgi:hypothetical protein